MSTKKQLIIICLLTLIVIQKGIPEVGALAPDTRLRIEPADLVVGLNETFAVQVVIEEANNLAAFQFDLAYDSSVLQVTEAAPGAFLESTGNSVVAVGPEVNDAEGRVTFGAVSFGGEPGPSGTGILATITCIAQGEGSTTLELQGVQILNTAASVQRVAVEDGRVVVRATAAAMPIATPMSTPEVVDTPTPVATALPSPTPTGTSSWAMPALMLAALAMAILAVLLILRLRQAG